MNYCKVQLRYVWAVNEDTFYTLSNEYDNNLLVSNSAFYTVKLNY